MGDNRKQKDRKYLGTDELRKKIGRFIGKSYGDKSNS